jgi:hypothetical protein
MTIQKGPANLGTGTIDATELASNSVTTAKIADANVTTAKLATTLTVTHALGSASTPSITFTGDTNTGIFSPTADTIAFAEGGVESMRIDSSGNIQIGQSVDTFPGAGNTVVGGGLTGTGRISFSSAGVPTGYFNRNTDNGELLSFRRQGTGVGSVNVTTTGTTYTGTNGITFTATQTASADANTLDDYEEGTFTPTLFGASSAGTTTYTSQNGTYTKIGRQVTVTVYVTASAATGTGELRIGNLPFTVIGNPNYFAAAYVTSLNWGGGSYLMMITRPGETNVEMQYMADDNTALNQNMVNETQGIGFTITYFT